MVRIPVRGLSWQQEQVIKRGTTAPGQQRSRCHYADRSPAVLRARSG